MNLFSVFRFHYVNLFKKTNILVVMVFLLIYCVSSFLSYGAAPTSDALASVYFVFYAPFIPTLDLFRALLLVTGFLLLFNQFIQSELKDRSSYILPRIKSTKLFFHSLWAAMMAFIFIFVLIGYVIALLLTFVFHQAEISQTEQFLSDINWASLVQQYLLLVLSVILLLSINLVMILLFKNIEIATLIIFLLFICSFYSVLFNPDQYLYIPFLYGFFNFQPSLGDRAFLLECVILCSSNLVLYLLSSVIYQKKKDLFS